MRYSTAEVAALSQWTTARVLALVRAGLLAPQRERRSYRFGFRDLVLIRTAKSLSEQGVSFAALRRALTALRSRLPEGRPLSALRLSTHGNRVLVDEEGVLYDPSSGQTQLRFEAPPAVPPATGPGQATRSIGTASVDSEDEETCYADALEYEDAGDTEAAIQAYRSCLHYNPKLGAAQPNLGRLLHDKGELPAAADCYTAALDDPETQAIAHFNLGTLHEEQGQQSAAIAAYQRAAEAGINDAHYNLARLYEQRGERDAALRHLMRFSRAEKTK